MKTMEELRRLWVELGDIPVDCDDNTELDFLGFDAGTDKLAIWHWFEDQNPDFVVHDELYKVGRSADS